MSDHGTDDSTPIYPHGFSVRVRITTLDEEVDRVLAVLNWPDGRCWVQYSVPGGRHRYQRRGSVWLSGRAPRNKNLGLSKLNAAWGTRLYGLGLEIPDEDGALDIDIVGVRQGDVRRLLEDVLSLPETDYRIDYYRQFEWFVVLSGPDAHALASAVGAQPKRGRGSISRKAFLIRDLPISVPIRRRCRSDARLSTYRITNGATALWKTEISLKGRRRDRSFFFEEDVHALREVLLELVRVHGIKPLPKPARWEPQSPTDAAWWAAPGLQRLQGRNYRGSKPSPQECHTLDDIVVVGCRRSTQQGGDIQEGTVVRDLLLSTDGFTDGEDGDGEGYTTTYMEESETASLPVLGTEEPLSSNHVEEFFSFLEDLNGTYGSDGGDVGAAPASTTDSGKEDSSPSSFSLRVHEVLFPSSQSVSSEVAVSSWESSLDAGEEPQWVSSLVYDLLSLPDGSIIEIILDADFDSTPVVEALLRRLGSRLAVDFMGPEDEIPVPLAELMSFHVESSEPELLLMVVDPFVPKSSLTPMMEEWRSLLEREGGKAIILSWDARSYWHPRPWVLESTVTAGRYYAHVRYRAEVWNHRVVAVDILKDEVTGRHGRRLWRPSAPPLPHDLDLDDLGPLGDIVGIEDDLPDLSLEYVS
jgi:hypothetical protein